MKKDQMESLSQIEVKLLIENALLEQEKRLSKEFRSELSAQTDKLINAVEKQNKLYSDQIITLTKDVERLNAQLNTLYSSVSNIKTRMLVIGSASATIGGLIGFFIATLTRTIG